jgi:DNA-binding transcriptional ArsR family regulator
MGNERRLVILCHLSEREHSVTELCQLVGLSQSALSQHLAKLRRDNLVKTRRAAQTVFYSVASPDVAPLLLSLSYLFGPGTYSAPTNRPCGPDSAGPRTQAWRK